MIRPGHILMLPALLLVGCVNRMTTQMPVILDRDGLEMQRRAAQIQDPFPDATYGPETGFRPLNYQQQRSDAQQTKDRFYSGFLRNQLNAKPTTQPVGPGAYGPGNYPGAVQ